MSEAKFTPAPWFVEDEEDKTIVCVKDGEICDIVVDCRPFKENLANAHLIAAAPEMYAMLQELDDCADYWSEYDVPIGIQERLKNVLKKALGEA